MTPRPYSRMAQRYLHDVIADYVDDGGTIRLESMRNGDPLSITFVLEDGDRYHLLLSERAERVHTVQPAGGGQEAAVESRQDGRRGVDEREDRLDPPAQS